ncbi:hypothetical protein PIB30_002519 [Stylosanthes scabra]|uniref:Uncharacterized protein n=1 Tax=Stylosanthes scabra TaxID=79078 RepID=A0ABU6Y390_9FABA|nr:hypothetical protein [Stylosanthes scabra]
MGEEGSRRAGSYVVLESQDGLESKIQHLESELASIKRLLSHGSSRQEDAHSRRHRRSGGHRVRTRSPKARPCSSSSGSDTEDAIWCRAFPVTLSGPASRWFDSLPPGSIIGRRGTMAFSETVLDRDGDPVVSGRPYFLGAIRWYPVHNYQRGITLGTTGKQVDPVTVRVDDSISYFDGIPVSFSIVGSSNPGATITTETPLEIKFTGINTLYSTRWIAFVNSEIQSLSVGIGGPKEHPGEAIIESTFSIYKDTIAYFLRYSVPTPGGGNGINYLYGNVTDFKEGDSPLVLTEDFPNLHFDIYKDNSDATHHPVL